MQSDAPGITGHNDMNQYLAVAESAITEARRLIAQGRRDHIVNWKGARDYATEVDVAIESRLKALLLKACPDTHLLAEENNASTSAAGLVWVLDPIDGTINFSRGHPNFGVSLALLGDGEALLSIVDFPDLGLSYRASRGKGAWRNGKPIRAAESSDLNMSIVAVGDFAVDADAARKNVERLRIVERLANVCLRVRMHGSAALDLCLVADGSIDASIMLSNSAWDVQGGALIAREAGAILCDSSGVVHGLNSAQTLCSSPLLQRPLLDALFK